MKSSKTKYVVEIILVGYNPSQIVTLSKTFKGKNLMNARRKAFEYAFDVRNGGQYKCDDPKLLDSIDREFHMLNLQIRFYANFRYEVVVFGNHVSPVLMGLDTEAKYYLQEGLLKQSDLMEILENSDDLEDYYAFEINEDEDFDYDDEDYGKNPIFVIADTYENDLPEFNYNSIRVIPEFFKEMFPKQCLEYKMKSEWEKNAQQTQQKWSSFFESIINRA